tara:strand:- start:398 stop:1009 length:612 start_codon:yes stop_codon:yes gene_type:complete
MHRNPHDKNRVILWARKVLSNKDNYVILDTETTGLGKRDVVLQMAIIDLNGNSLFNSLIKPTKRKSISKEAIDIHGITINSLKDAPTFNEIFNKIEEIIKHKTILIYNAEYDERIIDQTSEIEDVNFLYMQTECVMLPYSEFKGKWSEYYYSYTYQKLPGGDHSAIGDCRATLALLNKMAETELIEVSEPKQHIEEKKWWQFW